MPKPRPMSHRWGKKVNVMMTASLLSQEAINRLLTPLHMSVELLPLGLFTKDHAEHVAKIVNLVAVDSSSKDNGFWQIADEVGQVLLAMKRRVDEGKSWNCTAEEKESLIKNITKMDKYIRSWTNRRFTIAAISVDRISQEAKAKGGKFLDRVTI